MTTEADLLATMLTARSHLHSGGPALFCPDWTKDCFAPVATLGGVDREERGMRYLEWPRRAISETTSETDLVYILHEADGARRIAHDRMTLGVFTRETWIRLLEKADFGQIEIAEQSGRDVFKAIAK